MHGEKVQNPKGSIENKYIRLVLASHTVLLEVFRRTHQPLSAYKSYL